MFVGDSVDRKIDIALNKGDDVVVCFPGTKLEAAIERVKKQDKGGYILVKEGNNNA